MGNSVFNLFWFVRAALRPDSEPGLVLRLPFHRGSVTGAPPPPPAQTLFSQSPKVARARAAASPTIRHVGRCGTWRCVGGVRETNVPPPPQSARVQLLSLSLVLCHCHVHGHRPVRLCSRPPWHPLASTTRRSTPLTSLNNPQTTLNWPVRGSCQRSQPPGEGGGALEGRVLEGRGRVSPYRRRAQSFHKRGDGTNTPVVVPQPDIVQGVNDIHAWLAGGASEQKQGTTQKHRVFG